MTGPRPTASTKPVALVTGGRRGIGLAIARDLARAGWDLAITDAVDDAIFDAAIGELRGLGATVAAETFDLADLDAHGRALDRIFATLGHVDCLVNNAGRGAVVRGDLLDLLPANFDAVLDVNLRGTVFLTQAITRRMLAAPATPQPRSIVTVTSVSAAAASPERTDYCISKAGLSMFVKALALRLAGTGIGVFEVRPGIIKTDMTAPVTEKYDRLIDGGLVPERRWGLPEDVARAVASLASGAFGFSTGAVIDVDGGLALPRL
ncbi:3-ketoacyl-ACP reductase [Methyloraptor flagellatus]|uniref:3-ketoacyl-ACP reductase n=1 Tax=Methyloraptor flagellatus TaxID=3162530 RepID=A0AAU7X9Y4_9HYPH